MSEVIKIGGCDGAHDLTKLLQKPETNLGPETINIFLHVFLTVTLRRKAPRKEAVTGRGEVKGITSFWGTEIFALRKYEQWEFKEDICGSELSFLLSSLDLS